MAQPALRISNLHPDVTEEMLYSSQVATQKRVSTQPSRSPLLLGFLVNPEPKLSFSSRLCRGAEGHDKRRATL